MNKLILLHVSETAILKCLV